MDVINYINCHLSFINFSESMMKTNEKELVLQGAKLRSQPLFVSLLAQTLLNYKKSAFKTVD